MLLISTSTSQGSIAKRFEEYWDINYKFTAEFTS